MIDGVKIKKITTHTHDRGNFREVLRDDDKLLKKFGQCSITVTYPGIIKAFHWHKKQDDLWYAVSGNAKVVLYDLRKDSKTFKQTQVICVGDNAESQLIMIPVGVAHGYQVLGKKPFTLMYFTTLSYDAKNPDEQRIAFDDKKINFDWEIKNQ
jgi:dTDP-4-dehydrorhamnose 3,5-epimerase